MIVKDRIGEQVVRVVPVRDFHSQGDNVEEGNTKAFPLVKIGYEGI
jgi:hypothetical protein